MKKVILITGATSGIGYETAGYLANQGHIVYGAGRRVENLTGLKQVKAIHLDMVHMVQSKM